MADLVGDDFTHVVLRGAEDGFVGQAVVSQKVFEALGVLVGELDGADVAEAVLRASQDYVREVVAHEVGHVLGLRHNFAGSLSSTLNREEMDQWFKAYISGTNSMAPWTNRYASSSIMEYTVFKAAME